MRSVEIPFRGKRGTLDKRPCERGNVSHFNRETFVAAGAKVLVREHFNMQAKLVSGKPRNPFPDKF